MAYPPSTLLASEAEEETTIIVAPGAEVVLQAPEATHRVEAAWNGGLALPVRSALTAPESGQHWLSVVSRDPGGNLSSIRWVRVIVDDTPPEVSLDFSTLPAADIANKEWLPVGTKITARAVDSESGVGGVSLVATSGPTGGHEEDAGEIEASVTLKEEGTYQIRVEALDGVENRSEPVTATYHLDGIGPYGHVFAEGPHLQLDDLLVVGSGAEIHVKMDDERSGIVHWMAEMDGESIEKSDFHSGWTYGRHEAGAMMMDLAGNHSAMEPVPFFFDDRGPMLQWEIQNTVKTGCEQRKLVAPPVHLTVSASDHPAGISTFETSLDGTTWTPAESELSVDTPGVYLRSTDGVGNLSTEHVTWDLDVSAPELYLTDKSGNEYPAGARFDASNGDVLKIKIVDDGCLVPTVKYRYEDGRAISAKGKQIRIDRDHCFIRPFVDRYCRITVDAVDQFGRESSASWKVEVARPSEGGAS